MLSSEEFREAHIAEGGEERHFIVISHAGEMFVLVDQRWLKAPWKAPRCNEYATNATNCASGCEVLFIGDFEKSSLIRMSNGASCNLPKHKIQRHNPTFCHMGSRTTFVAGGVIFSFNQTVAALEMFHNNRWMELTDMPRAAAKAVAGVIGTKLYIAGGYSRQNGWTFLKCLQIYDATRGSWELGPDMPESLARPNYSGVVIGNHFLVVGESRETNKLVCFCFSPDSMQWKSIPFVGLDSAGEEVHSRVYAINCEGCLLISCPNTKHPWHPAVQLQANGGKWSKVPREIIPGFPLCSTQIRRVCSSVLRE